MELQQRLALRVMRHLDVVQQHAVAEARAQGLDRRLLGGEPARQKIGLAGIAVEFLQFIGGENALGKTLAVAVQVLLHARHAHDVGTDAEYHISRNTDPYTCFPDSSLWQKRGDRRGAEDAEFLIFSILRVLCDSAFFALFSRTCHFEADSVNPIYEF